MNSREFYRARILYWAVARPVMGKSAFNPITAPVIDPPAPDAPPIERPDNPPPAPPDEDDPGGWGDDSQPGGTYPPVMPP